MTWEMGSPHARGRADPRAYACGSDESPARAMLRDVAEARGMTQAARSAKLNRENLYRMLASNGNPQFSTLNALLHSLGLRLAVEIGAPSDLV